MSFTTSLVRASASVSACPVRFISASLAPIHFSSDAKFSAAAEAVLTAVSDAVEDAIESLPDSAADVTHSGGVVSLAVGDGRTFILNKQSAAREIWLSSPVSGPTHYVPCGDESASPSSISWINSQPSVVPDLIDKLRLELSATLGSKVDISL
jgi:iron donor protein CyaY